ncbi:MAG TPA: hypothetical protein VGZ22_15935 [Isosphaeraceae bacterium]|jgi:hypothetical protein|nr:hypothetical protein [Isosphaeraceae bacterium]
MRNSHRNRWNRPLEVEPLESMTLLSGMPMMSSPPMAAPMIPAPPLPLPIIVSLNGTTHGFYASQQTVPDVGTTYSVLSFGKFAHYGTGLVFGTLHSLGNIASGIATGTLHVILPRGTLTLALTGPTQSGFSPLPKEFSFTITSGTGRFHDFVGDPVGKGTVDVTLQPDASSTATHGHGRITLAFHPGVVVLA